MSPSKSKSKSSGKAAKELKASSKSSSSPSSTGNGISANAYNPVSGTFHALETAPVASSPPSLNGRFRNMYETDLHSGSSLGTGAEYDSVSNNDSCSGDSEDQKDKAASVAPRPETIPGADNDKREKIRLKNERKHQRQRERRAQELHERCSGFLMSRKLESLAQQLVAMGFPLERATMALILNDGRVEESVAWLFEGGEDETQQKDANIHSGGNLKIDITEELSRITEMEAKHKCTKQEVERAVVSCEGDLDKAEELLKVQKPEPTAASPKQEGIGDLRAAVDGGKQVVSDGQNPMRTLTKSVAAVSIQPRRDERDFNYTKMAVPAVVSSETGSRNLQSLRRIQPKSEWSKVPVAAVPSDKRWPNMTTSPSASYPLASPLQVVQQSTSKTEARYVVSGSEVKNLPKGAVREPVIMMQRPQTINAKHNPATGHNPMPTTAGRYTCEISGIDVMKSNAGLGRVPSSSLSSSNLTSQQFFQQQQYQPFSSSSLVESTAGGWGSSWNLSGTTSSTSLGVPSSLGLFTGWGSTGTSGSSSPVDWSMGASMPQCDYNNIDWSLESTSSRQSDLWMGLTSCIKKNRIYDGWSMSPVEANGSRLAVNGVCLTGLQDVVPDATSSVDLHEWTSPFAGKDLFSLPRQFVTSPSQ